MELSMKIYATITLLTLLFISTLTSAKTVYIAENISTPVYAGPGLGEKISNRLLPGTKVTVIKKDNRKKFALVEWAKGKSGWLSTRKLTSLKPALARLKIAGYEMDTLRKKIKLLESNKKTLKGKKAVVASIDPSLFNSFNETISNQAQSISKLQVAIEALTKNNKDLSKQITMTSKTFEKPDGTKVTVTAGNEIDWFLWGGFVVALSFISGILITKVRWRKDRLFS